MKRGLQAMAQRFDALSVRDKLTLAAGFIAALVGIEMLLVAPLQDRRAVLASAAAADAAAQADQLQAARAQRRALLAELQARGAQVDQQLAELGLEQVSSRNPAGFIVAAVMGTRVALVSLRGLPVESIAPAAAGDDGASAASAPAAAPLYRHRAELRLEGSVQDLVRALAALERGVAPLRIEQVLVAPGGDGRGLQATVVLTAINRERTWFTL